MIQGLNTTRRRVEDGSNSSQRVVESGIGGLMLQMVAITNISVEDKPLYVHRGSEFGSQGIRGENRDAQLIFEEGCRSIGHQTTNY